MFWERLKVCIKHFWKIELSRTEKTFIEILNKPALMKKKMVRGNQAPYMMKSLRKATMRRSELENICFKLKQTIRESL